MEFHGRDSFIAVKMIEPTSELRWFIYNTKPVLQQKWRDLSNGEEHWEDVPEVRGETNE